MKNSPLAEAISSKLKEHPSETAILPLVVGEAALMARLATLEEAKQSVDMQYYIWHWDLTGRLLTHFIIKAADRGVRIRMLLDDFPSRKHQKELALLDHHPNIEVRLANPFVFRFLKVFEIFRFRKINRRMHNKTFIVDNVLAIIGGRNIGDEYFDARDGMNFKDLDLWMSGDIVDEISKQFDLYWNHEISYPMSSILRRTINQKTYEDFLKNLSKVDEEAKNSQYTQAFMSDFLARNFSRFPEDVYWGKAEFLYDPPYKITNVGNKPGKYLAQKLRPNLDNIKKELILVSPYFIPAKSGMKLLRELRKKGIEVTILTNSLASTDVSIVFGGYKNYRKELLDIGVHLYEFRLTHSKEIKKKVDWMMNSISWGLHTKAFVFDREQIYVGSMNLDPRSKNLNTEIGVVVQDSPLAHDMAERLLRVLPEIAYRLEKKGDHLLWITKNGTREVVFDEEPETTWWKRFKACILGIVIPESLL